MPVVAVETGAGDADSVRRSKSGCVVIGSAVARLIPAGSSDGPPGEKPTRCYDPNALVLLPSMLCQTIAATPVVRLSWNCSVLRFAVSGVE